jgi:hypothetical protein
MPYSDYTCTTCGRNLYDVYKGRGPAQCALTTRPTARWVAPVVLAREVAQVRALRHDMDGEVTKVSDIGQVRKIEEESLRRHATARARRRSSARSARTPATTTRTCSGSGSGPSAAKQPFITRQDHKADRED